jgi:hypothetical protein
MFCVHGSIILMRISHHLLASKRARSTTYENLLIFKILECTCYDAISISNTTFKLYSLRSFLTVLNPDFPPSTTKIKR